MTSGYLHSGEKCSIVSGPAPDLELLRCFAAFTVSLTICSLGNGHFEQELRAAYALHARHNPFTSSFSTLRATCCPARSTLRPAVALHACLSAAQQPATSRSHYPPACQSCFHVPLTTPTLRQAADITLPWPNQPYRKPQMPAHRQVKFSFVWICSSN